MANFKCGTGVSTADPESISPRSSPRLDGKASLHSLVHTKQHHATGAKRLLGRPALNTSSSSLQSPTSTASFTATPDADPQAFEDERLRGHMPHLRHHSHSGHVMSQVLDWLQREKAKNARRKSKRQESRPTIISSSSSLISSLGDGRSDTAFDHGGGRERADSDVSDSSVDFESLENILAGVRVSKDANATPKDEKRGSHFSRRLSAKHYLPRKSSGLASSDTDYLDGDAVVPSADVVLDNSKTLGYSGGEADSQPDSRKRGLKEKEDWLHFKKEIVRLAHTLRLKGWRRVSLDRGGEINVERLSGALTNTFKSTWQHLFRCLRKSTIATTVSIPSTEISKCTDYFQQASPQNLWPSSGASY